MTHIYILLTTLFSLTDFYFYKKLSDILKDLLYAVNKCMTLVFLYDLIVNNGAFILSICGLLTSSITSLFYLLLGNVKDITRLNVCIMLLI